MSDIPIKQDLSVLNIEDVLNRVVEQRESMFEQFGFLLEAIIDSDHAEELPHSIHEAIKYISRINHPEDDTTIYNVNFYRAKAKYLGSNTEVDTIYFTGDIEFQLTNSLGGTYLIQGKLSVAYSLEVDKFNVRLFPAYSTISVALNDVTGFENSLAPYKSVMLRFREWNRELSSTLHNH